VWIVQSLIMALFQERCKLINHAMCCCNIASECLGLVGCPCVCVCVRAEVSLEASHLICKIGWWFVTVGAMLGSVFFSCFMCGFFLSVLVCGWGEGVHTSTCVYA